MSSAVVISAETGLANVKKRGTLAPELIQYFRSIAAALETPESPEATLLMVENVMEETKGHEYHLSRSASCSSTIEKVLKLCTSFAFRKFVAELKDRMFELSMDRCGSHVVGAIIARMPELVTQGSVDIDTKGNDDEVLPPSVIDLFLSILDEFQYKWVELMSDVHGSFIVRNIITMSTSVKKDDESKALYKKTKSILKEIVESIVSNPAKSVENAHESTYSLCYQALLEALSKRAPDQIDQFCDCILGWTAYPDSSRRVIRHIRQLFCDKSGSHLIEHVYKYASDDMVAKVIGVMAGWVVLAKHAVANFVIQALLERLNESHTEHILKACEDLIPNISSLLETRGAVVWKLVECCARNNVETASISKAVLNAINEKSTSESKLLYKFLRLNSKDSSGFSPVGSSLLTAMLKLPLADCSVVLESVLSATVNEIYDLCCDKFTSRMLEQIFLAVHVRPQQKKHLIKRLKGCFVDLALDKFGSYLVEKIHFAGDLSQKSDILKELAASSHRLSNSPFGKYVMASLKVESFKQQGSKWEEKQKSSKKTAELFSDIIGDSKVDKKEDLKKSVKPKSVKEEVVVKNGKDELDESENVLKIDKQVDEEMDDLFSSLNVKKRPVESEVCLKNNKKIKTNEI